jgi:glutamate-ammonia-ligase adenylyltransferase
MSGIELPESAPAQIRESLAGVLAASDFIAQTCERDPQLLSGLIAAGDLTGPGSPASAARFARSAPHWTPGAPPVEAVLMGQLREWRRREMVRIAWRDLAGWASLEETLGELTAFADAAIAVACRHACETLAQRYGEPRSPGGLAQPLLVIGMGKLGGGELNFSSDIDLVLLFPEGGETDGPRPIANEEFFTRAGQALIRLLDAPTSVGQVFRVDMRLRPFGASGPLVASFSSFEDYLQRHGRDWERYAWIKARPITAVERYGEIYSAAVRPFVYRRYLDFGVFQSLREMKGLIEREVSRREIAEDVKLGPGGIREIEFIVQSLQLIRGGQDARLRTRSLLEALPRLEGGKLLSAHAVDELRAAYRFLRALENRLQMLADEQTHRLPKEPSGRARIAAAMGQPDWAALAAELEGHRRRVAAHFRAVVSGAESPQASQAVALDLESLWSTQAETAALLDAVRRVGFAAYAEEAARLLLALRDSTLVRRLDEPGRKRLQALLPGLVSSIGASREPLTVLRRILRILEAIGARSVYFALLCERADARTRLIELCAHSEFLAQQLASYPMLLDELIDERLLSHLPARGALEKELQLRIEQLHEDDPERQVEALCHFQQAAIFRIAVADLTGRLPLMQVSDRLTEVAELIVEQALEIAWRQITAQFGAPMCGEGAARRGVAICAAGYGKLGGIELGYSSDLDLVFLHDSEGERQETDGARPIDNQLFFVRLAQRIVHLLTMHSAAGRLYEVDVRLRPSGKGGLLVTSIRAFAEYQQHEAWTWEHQALLHARAVAGDPELRARFESVRLAVLQEYVRRETLREDVRSMRERMRRELSKAKPGTFDIKQDAGGVADIEFLAQYWALRWAREYPPVVMFSDTIRQLESVASADLVPQAAVDVLTGAYRAYRARTHHLSLEGRVPIVSEEEFVAERAAITALWDRTMSTPEA